MKHFISAAYRFPQHVLMGLVKVYRLLLSPWLGGACRFEPTCSQYALTALGQHGAVTGASLTLYRLLRCQPWCEGGHDPVPATTFFTRLITPVNSTTLCPEKKPL